MVQAIPCYSMLCFRLPKRLINEINTLAARFWWGVGEEDLKIHWVGWQTMCKPKCQGGLGFRDLELFNKTLLAKQGWRIMNDPNYMLSWVLKGQYFRDGTFMTAKTGENPSFIWRSLMWGRNLLKEGVQWRIGNGESVRIYEDNWIPNHPNLKILSTPRFPIDSKVSLFMPDGLYQ